jgi:ssDNA thymidine ADP-ribosyltransferase, DarT
MANYERLNATNAYIWRIVHRHNLPWLLDNGLVCANAQALDPNFVAIGNAELIGRRSGRFRSPLVEPSVITCRFIPRRFRR